MINEEKYVTPERSVKNHGICFKCLSYHPNKYNQHVNDNKDTLYNSQIFQIKQLDNKLSESNSYIVQSNPINRELN